MEQASRSMELTGGDHFVLALDRQMRSAGFSGNICRLVLRLEEAPTREELRTALKASPLTAWLANVRHARRLPLQLPHWRANGQRGEISVGGGEQAINEASHLPLFPKRVLWPETPPAVAFDLLPAAGNQCDLVLTWHHALMDARGAELLLGALSGGNAGHWPPEQLLGLSQPTSLRGWLSSWRTLWRRSMFARKSILFISKASQPPLAMLGRTRQENATAAHRFHLIDFDEEETAIIDQRCTESSVGFRESLFLLAAVIRGALAVLRERRQAPGAFLIPVPQDQRRRGFPGPVFSNHVTFFFYRIEADEAENRQQLLASLKKQMEAQIRDRIPQSYAEMMSLFRRMPLPLYSRILRGPSEGRMASLFFSYTGECLAGQERFLGRRILDATHLAPVSAPPGFSAVFTRFRGRLRATISWVESCLEGEELDLFERTLCAELLEDDES